MHNQGLEISADTDRDAGGEAGGRYGVARAADMVIFLGILALSAIAVLALAVAAPIALALSALAGLFDKKDNRGQWRPAGI